ncbi:winged helix-turn-helix domain-containing protein [Streptomyces hyaluromycini]|uniref:Winged helix-turn-helix domain-containing protein n=1 Tax=Streptomyces hyaluromycini TaxID=1377993 RepID=A0ABV1WSB4_9ACTN
MVDPSDEAGGGRAFRLVLVELRRRLSGGRYPVGTLLPPQRALAEEFGVSRDTVQRVLSELRAEGWIESRQGQGSRVLVGQPVPSATPRPTGFRPPTTLGPVIGEAFERDEVALDVYTLTSESLYAHIRVQSERIHAGVITPQRIAVRLILPAETLSMPYPRAVGDPGDPRLPTRLRAITRAHTASLRTVLEQLRSERLVPCVEFEVRRAELTPAFELYAVNGDEVLHGPCLPVVRTVFLGDGDGEEAEAVDVLGLGATLTRHVGDADQDSPGSVFVTSMTAWFDAVWELLAE